MISSASPEKKLSPTRPLREHPVLAQAVDRVPALADLLRRHGSLSLREYAARLQDYRPDAPQDHSDVAATAGEVAAKLLGEETGSRLAQCLREHPVVVTGPHHGFDTMPVTVQGTLAFSLGMAARGAMGRARNQTVCVMGSSNVPLSNYTTPGGLALARCRNAGQDATQHTRVHFFPTGERARLVRGCPPVTPKMVEHVRRRVQALFQEKTLNLREKRGLDRLLKGVFADKALLGQSDLARQATLAASALWSRMLPDAGGVEFVHLDKDEIVCRLLRRDLADPASLVHRVFFSSQLRQRVMQTLDGAYGCWSARRLDALSVTNGETHEGATGEGPVGTAFFWGLDGRGGRVPLRLDEDLILRCACPPDAAKECALYGDAIPFTPQGLDAALEQGTVVPGLFTTFLTICFARGVRCVGGQLQAGYLPVMQQALVGALREQGGAQGAKYSEDAQRIDRMPVRAVVTGLMGVVCGDPAISGLTATDTFRAASRDTSEYTVGYTSGRMPGRMAGSMEIILAGGLDASARERLGALTVEQALFAGMLEMYPVLFCARDRLPDWEAGLRRTLAERMEDRLVMLP